MKKLPIGISDFRELRENDYFFLDTSEFIGNIYREDAKSILITRPRRFGKTLNMSMLNYFFDNTLDTAHLFDGLKVTQDSRVMESINGYPTVFISFKDIKNNNWKDAFENIKNLISKIYSNKERETEKTVAKKDKTSQYKSIINKTASDTDYQNAFLDLTEYLNRAYDKPVLLMIDEYDVPIQSGWTHGYYEDVIDFMRIFLSAALKDNPHLFKSIMTGIYRVAKESIFSGLNNLKVYTVLDRKYSEYFGFTESEIEWILLQLGKENDDSVRTGLREWYNGYTFGGITVYNPWSVINYLYDGILKPYWINTSSNDLIISLVEENLKRKESFREELETLVSGGYIQKSIDDSSALREIGKVPNALWTLFLFSGYLKPDNVSLERGKYVCDLKIPNEEVNIFFQDTVINWLNCEEYDDRFAYMTKALMAGDSNTFCERLKAFVSGTLSYYDIGKVPENAYHMLLLGMFSHLQGGYHVKSNRESGLGRYDILLKAKDKDNYSVIIEIKKGTDKLEEAIAQIEQKDYAAELASEGYTRMMKVAIGADGKNIDVLVSKK